MIAAMPTIDPPRGADAPVADTRPRAMPALLWGNVVAGAGTLLPAALLAPMAADLGAGVAATGQVLTVFAAAMAVSAPLLATATARLERRTLLVATLAAFSVLTAASALVQTLAMMLLVRALAGIACGLITPQVATTAGLLVPAERRSQAIAWVFNGYALAIVGGLSVGAWVGDWVGWRWAILGVAAMGAMGAAWLAATVPAGLRVPPLDLGTMVALLRDRAMVMMLAVTTLQATGQFMVYSYLGPLLERQAGIEPRHAGLAFAALAATGVVGGVFAARLLRTVPPARVVAWNLLLMALGFVSWPLIGATGGAAWALAWVALAWGTPCFAINMAQQARLVQARPAVASLSIALNSSSMFVGQAVGTALAGALIHADLTGALSWIGTAMIVAAWGISRRIGHAPA